MHNGKQVYRVEQTETTNAQKERGAKIVRCELYEVLSKGTLAPEEFLADAANHMVCNVERVGADTKRADVGVCAMNFSATNATATGCAPCSSSWRPARWSTAAATR